MEMQNTGIRRETVVYKEPESTEKSGTAGDAKVDKKTKPINVLNNAIETGNILRSEHHNMTATTTQGDYQPRGMIPVTETHELHCTHSTWIYLYAQHLIFGSASVSARQ
ncbi:hypothetical protein A1F94_011963 [Pyrenophora tritici-repentis]|nr:hypothetical protein A1F94_011963 [Pyrenophora tritici-repentis]